jgi:hypothetical protein
MTHPEPQRDGLHRYCARLFTQEDLQTIRRIISAEPNRSRYQISRLVCEALGWFKPNGTLKDMSCRVALLRMHREGLIQLPPPRQGHNNGKALKCRSAEALPGSPLHGKVTDLQDLELVMVRGRKDSRLWNEYIERYHYLGYKKLPGAQLRYFAVASGQVIAALGFGAAAWKTAPRDRFIGWSDEQRRANLHLVVNNARFLILPWIRSYNLASCLLSKAARRLRDDWCQRYAYLPALLETFVQTDRFRGTSYKAANWIYLGQTKGRGKLDVDHTANEPIKSVWVYPLTKDFREQLTQ